MDALTPEQEAQLAEVMQELGRLATPNVIFESARLRVPNFLDEAAKRQFRSAYAGVIAAEKIMVYMPVLETANQRRIEFGRQIEALMQRANDLAMSDPLVSIEPEIQASHLSGEQEVQVHLFAVVAKTIAKLLPFAARAAGYRIRPDERRTLMMFDDLRDFYEHLEQRLPGQRYAAEAVQEPEEGQPWWITFGIPIDADGRHLIRGNAIEVSTESLRAVQEVVARIWAELKTSALQHAEAYFRANPDRIPHPSRVDSGFSVTVGGRLAGARPFRPYGRDVEGWELVGGIWVPGSDQPAAK